MKDEKLENLIMGKIKAGQVKIKSKYIFLAEKLGLGTAFTLSVFLSIIFLNLIFFYFKETDNLKYLSFGKFGIFAFLESFPYLMVIVFIILIFLSGYLLTKNDFSYKKPFGFLAIGMILSIMIFAGILTYTNLGQNFENQARLGNESARIFFRSLMDIRKNGISGIVFEKEEDYLILQTPQGLRRIETTNMENNVKVEKGQFVVIVGSGKNFNFKANKVRLANKEDLPSISRGIDFKFKEFDEKDMNISIDLLHFDEIEKKCIKECLDLRNGSKCFKECYKK
jgi:hypothetical protein